MKLAIMFCLLIFLSTLNMNGAIHSETLGTHDAGINTIAFNPTGKLLASGSEDGEIKLWNVDTKSLVHTMMKRTQAITDLEFNHAGTMFAAACKDGTVSLWDKTGTFLRELTSGKGAANCIAFSPDDTLLACGVGDESINIWNPHTGKNTQQLDDNYEPVTALRFHHSGKYLICACSCSPVNIYETSTWEKLPFIQFPEGVTALELIPEENYVAFRKGNGQIIVYGFLNDNPMQTNLEVCGAPVHKIAIDAVPLDYLIANPHRCEILIYDKQGQLLLNLTGHAAPIRAVVFNKRHMLASCSDDKTIRLWENEKLKQQIFTLALALHSRCGSKSHAKTLSTYLIQKIAMFLKNNTLFFESCPDVRHQLT